MPSTSTSMQAELEALRNVYERSQARVNGTDPEWNVREEMLQKQIYTAVKTFKSEDAASKAVFIIGSIQAAVNELEAPRINVLSYETKRKRYAELCAQENKAPVQF